GALICTLGVIIPSFIICLTLAHFYYKYRNFSGVQTILSSLRPAVVSLISSAGLSILTLALFQAEKHEIILSNFRIVEFALFVGGLVALRKFKLSPIPVIFGSGLIGTIIYMIF
ncbi:chromate transporter, partial [Turicibacter sanguinis]|nr:chromate transporter [Turicibacter sanguinis]